MTSTNNTIHPKTKLYELEKRAAQQATKLMNWMAGQYSSVEQYYWSSCPVGIERNFLHQNKYIRNSKCAVDNTVPSDTCVATCYHWNKKTHQSPFLLLIGWYISWCPNSLFDSFFLLSCLCFSSVGAEEWGEKVPKTFVILLETYYKIRRGYGKWWSSFQCQETSTQVFGRIMFSTAHVKFLISLPVSMFYPWKRDELSNYITLNNAVISSL